MRFFGETEKAQFISRPNRFTVLCNLNGKVVKAHLPNPGRMWELLLPDVTVHIEYTPHRGRKTHNTLVAVERNGIPIILHTHRANDVAEYLINSNSIPGLSGLKVIKKEFTIGKSRFDFLLQNGSRNIILEVKSCTLFGRNVAMFPDAITERGRRHVEELASLSQGKQKGAVLFLVNSPHVDIFMPEHHTNLAFTHTLYEARNKVMVIPLSLTWHKDLTLAPHVKVLKIPWRTIDKEAKDRGVYLFIMKLATDTFLNVEKTKKINFKKGYYIYTGSAKAHLTKRIERHKRIRKRQFWHIDYLRPVAEVRAALPIRTEDELECEIAGAIKGITEYEVPGFGASDCSCNSHLLFTHNDPLNSPQFHLLLQYYRMDRYFKTNKGSL